MSLVRSPQNEFRSSVGLQSTRGRHAATVAAAKASMSALKSMSTADLSAQTPDKQLFRDDSRRQTFHTSPSNIVVHTPSQVGRGQRQGRDLAVALRTVDDLRSLSNSLSDMLAAERSDAERIRAENEARAAREAQLEDEIDALSADVFCLRAENNASVSKLQRVREQAFRHASSSQQLKR